MIYGDIVKNNFIQLTMTWEKGESGNPKGRPKGSGHLYTAVRNKILEAYLKYSDAQMHVDMMQLTPQERLQVHFTHMALVLPKDEQAAMGNNIRKFIIEEVRGVEPPNEEINSRLLGGIGKNGNGSNGDSGTDDTDD